jgi:hypothetical protein
MNLSSQRGGSTIAMASDRCSQPWFAPTQGRIFIRACTARLR